MEKKSKSVRTFLFFFLTRNVKTKKMVSNIGQSDTTATSPLGGKFPNGRSSSSSVLLLYNSPTLNSTTRVADALRIKRGLETHHGSCCSAATPCTRFYLMNRAATHHGSGTRPLESQHFFFFSKNSKVVRYHRVLDWIGEQQHKPGVNIGFLFFLRKRRRR